MIIMKIQGGLGNQLFQYALGKNLAIKNNAELKLDTTDYEKESGFREYGLADFNINAEIATNEEINKFTNNWKKIKNKFLPPYHRSIFVKLGYEFDERVLTLKNDVYLYGYWQSEKYFKDIERVIRAEITLKKELTGEANRMQMNIQSVNSVSLHIRRGDYLGEKISKVLETCGLDYYARAINKIAVVEKNPTFFIFSDDIAWAKNNLKINFPVVFVSGENIKIQEELFLMSLCQHDIIANSSFSWWGAWLNKNPDKIIIAPNNWLKDKNIKTDDLIPNAWQRI